MASPTYGGSSSNWATAEQPRHPTQPGPQHRSLQLATEILARTLGIHADVAVAWQRLSAGDWADCAAEVSHRYPPGRQHDAP
ncbi:hypothetical protein ACFYXM_22660 [Streptomyces sp. NPDC002476]|uniref:hypothetical protein n=1 Tax=Streptomyces sp. NPDC002476 TaxID=3364648 RepID=UPI00369C8AF2